MMAELLGDTLQGVCGFKILGLGKRRANWGVEGDML